MLYRFKKANAKMVKLLYLAGAWADVVFGDFHIAALHAACHLDTFAYAVSIQRVVIRLRATLQYAGSKRRYRILRGSSSRLEGILIIDGLLGRDP
jgi:hypothetical protein